MENRVLAHRTGIATSTAVPGRHDRRGPADFTKTRLRRSRADDVEGCAKGGRFSSGVDPPVWGSLPHPPEGAPLVNTKPPAEPASATKASPGAAAGHRWSRGPIPARRSRLSCGPSAWISMAQSNGRPQFNQRLASSPMAAPVRPLRGTRRRSPATRAYQPEFHRRRPGR